jgi:ABC-2 type transport system ATP-binding protein
MISIRQLTVKFGQFTAVNCLDLEVKKGELFGFLGPNGAGKSTTIKVLTGAVKPSAGNVLIDQFHLASQFEQIKRMIGYVPDTENHIEDFTGRENLEFYAKLYRVDNTKVDFWLAKLQLTEAADVKVASYSKGMKKKLLIARELIHSPQLVFFDEPTANLDAHSIQLVRKILKELTAQGVTVFLTTHDMQEVEEICDRVAILAKGKLIACETPTSFITKHAERFCDVQYDENGEMHRQTIHLDNAIERQTLADIILQKHCVRVHSREFRFEDVFKKLTGEVYT